MIEISQSWFYIFVFSVYIFGFAFGLLAGYLIFRRRQ